MTVTSAGVLLYRMDDAGVLQLWIVHMGGPYWARKDEAAWSIPKGEYVDGEDPFAAALREYEEEIGAPPPEVEYHLLGQFKQPSRKLITVYLAEATDDVTFVGSNTFELEWPPRSGKRQQFPEVDDARWFPVSVAETKLVKGQRPIALRAREYLSTSRG
ncbi:MULTISPECIES: NUDIX domain-containing protein [unclassified Rhodococcus (in: high G+C Gram-positive bacteria)]|uniref:NUDIX domain-containing protein n=1 Tax=unclassified Rhodococcus (in: high G+C Gram-positive bacteria) TaxID=192944 RepID=UPI00163B5CF2|nr:MULTISPECIES: NUDIX domain-containing protein [unclassified Rhodococcus (in: high G+C Gram-positive bacteria)]MBC2641771.1 NUDIX domain-containing protein [Rhodococcus sp. 3A]MBC2893484.1 NUDIX domain-containing protein [Rhodococcus sp. 4CII]